MSFAVLKSGVVAAVFAGVGFAQTTIHTTTTLVVVPTVVQTPDKKLVYSLTADDFIVTDNGIPQKVSLEEESQRPLSLVVLMQTGGIARGQFPNYGNLEGMLAEIVGGAPNEVSIVTFDSQPEGASPFTADIEQWHDAINHPEQGDSGAAIYDGIAYALKLLKKEQASNRRAILLISQERDNGSKTPLKEIVRDLGESNTAVYSITFSAQKTEVKQAFKDPPHGNPPLHVGNGDYVAYFDLAEPLRLIFGAMQKNTSEEMAAFSGGEWSGFDNKNELSEALGRVNSHIRNSYSLSFYPTSTEPGLHTIKVQLAHHPEWIVSARSSYWATDSAADETH